MEGTNHEHQASSEMAQTNCVGSLSKAQTTLLRMGEKSFRKNATDRTRCYGEFYEWRSIQKMVTGSILKKQLLKEAKNAELSSEVRLCLFLKLAKFSQGDGWVPWVEIRESGVKDGVLGLFALREFHKGEIIGWLFDSDKRLDPWENDVLSLGMGTHYIQNPVPRGRTYPGQYRSYKWINCVVDDEGCVYATKGIHKNKELYGDLETAVVGSSNK